MREMLGALRAKKTWGPGQDAEAELLGGSGPHDLLTSSPSATALANVAGASMASAMEAGRGPEKHAERVQVGACRTSPAPQQVVHPCSSHGELRPSKMVHRGSQPLQSCHLCAQSTQMRTQVAAMASGLGDHTGLLAPPSARVPGAKARSRWRHPDGSWEWRECVVAQPSSDGAFYVVRWEGEGPGGWAALGGPWRGLLGGTFLAHVAHHNRGSPQAMHEPTWGRPPNNCAPSGGVKSVSRFNILFEGETEATLEALRAAALEHQKKMRSLGLHRSAMDALPDEDAPPMDASMMAAILARVGGAWEEGGPQLQPGSQEAGHGAGTSPSSGLHSPLRASAAAPSRGGATGPSSPLRASTAAAGGRGDQRAGVGAPDLLLQLSRVTLHHSMGVADSQAGVAAAGYIGAAPPPPRPHPITAGTAAPTSVLPVRVMGWRLGHDEAWHKFQHASVPEQLLEALQEANRQYAITHNRLAYRAAFAKETGLQVGLQHCRFSSC